MENYENNNELNQAFTIENDASADWAVRKILEEEAERDRLIAIAKMQIAELKERIEGLNESCENSTGYLKHLLARYFETVPHKESKTQETYKLLSGKLIKKKPGYEYKYDDAELAQFLADEKMNDYIDIQVKPRWGEFKKSLAVSEGGQVYIKETGEMVDVIKAIEVPASFTVK